MTHFRLTGVGAAVVVATGANRFTAAKALIAAYALLTSAASAAAPEEIRSQRAGRLVNAALEAELAGDAMGRADLIAQALAMDPDLPAARWQSGQVFYESAWRRLDEVHDLAQHDRRLEDYRELRGQSADDLAGNLELARWCTRQRLTGQARFHWAKVLWVDATNREARAALGLYDYGDGLYTARQIAEMKRQAEQAKKEFDCHSKTFMTWLREAASDDSAVREGALAKFRGVRDPAALPALEHVAIDKAANRRGVVTRLGKERSRELRRDLCLALVAAMNGMPEHAATLRLVDFAVFNMSAEIRQAAAKALQPRKKTDFVPRLMAALAAPIEADINVNATPDGTVSLGVTYHRAGPESDVRYNRGRDVVAFTQANRRGRTGRLDVAVANNYQQAARAADAAAMMVEQANLQTQQINERVQDVLKVAAGMDQGAKATALWQEWFSYNELYAEEHPVYETNDYQTQYLYLPPPGAMSCFVAGTPVWTETGVVLIERIMPGDLVLAQHPETGELAYRPVMQTTVRPPSPLVTIDVNGGQIVTTRGHRFWVNGQGWQMAKFLEPRMQLHALDRGAAIESVDIGEPSDGQEAYNLVVEGFHTYFVGESQLLVCDNSCPQPTLAVVPGLVSKERGTSSVIRDAEFSERSAPSDD
jgi:hypothetical protein